MSTSRRVAVPSPKLRPIDRLIEIMRILRSDEGCPWDREQTLEKLKAHLIEETYEVIDAIDAGHRPDLCEELGDLLLQIVFQSQICSESDDFSFDDVANAIVEKLIRRHPHVFGDTDVSNSGEVLKNWEKIKQQEKGNKPRSVIEGVPRSLPALHRAHALQKRVARVGFDWESAHGALDKLEEEIREVREAFDAEDEASIREEIGDVMFAAANLSRFYGHNAEDILHDTIVKFSRRFQQLEEIASSEGKSLTGMSLEEMDAIWNRVKKDERKP